MPSIEKNCAFFPRKLLKDRFLILCGFKKLGSILYKVLKARTLFLAAVEQKTLFSFKKAKILGWELSYVKVIWNLNLTKS